jgi:glycosyltransferase involved in cell wall biosynthesis
VERALARRLDAVVAAGPDIAARFAGLGIPAVTVGNYPLVEDTPTVAPWAERERAVCYVGNITLIRGLLEIVDAAELAGVRLVLAGRITRPEHRAAAVRRPGWRGVEEVGHATREQVARIYSRVRAGLVVLHPDPNFVTGHQRTTKLFEYMLAGLPVIVSDFPGWRAMVEAHACGICVDPLDPAAIARAIRQIMDDPAEAERMGRRGREAVLERYTWATEARKLLDLYASLLGR